MFACAACPSNCNNCAMQNGQLKCIAGGCASGYYVSTITGGTGGGPCVSELSIISLSRELSNYLMRVYANGLIK